MTGFATVPTHDPGDTFPSADWDIVAANMNNGGLYRKIADATLSVAAASIDFQNVDQTFASLKLVMSARGDNANPAVSVQIRFNSDSGSTSYFDVLGQFTDAATAETGHTAGASSAQAGNMPGSTAAVAYFGALSIEIPDYTSVVKNKSFVGMCYLLETSGTGNQLVNLFGGAWNNAGAGAAAITRVTLLAAAGNFAAGTRATLYGLPQ